MTIFILILNYAFINICIYIYPLDKNNHVFGGFASNVS